MSEESIDDVLPSPWDRADIWFKNHELQVEFRHLINCMMLHSKVGGLGNFLAVLSLKDSIELLRSFEDSESARLLLRLATAYGSSNDFPDGFAPYPDTVNAASQFKGDIAHLYMLALCATRIPNSIRSKSWITKLRTWLFIRALDYYFLYGSVADEYLRIAAHAVRKAIESASVAEESSYLKLIIAVEVVATSSGEFRSAFDSRIAFLASESGDGKNEKRILRAFQHLLHGHPRPFKDGAAPPRSWNVPPSATVVDESEDEEDDDVSRPKSAVIQGGDSAENIVVVKSLPGRTPAQEALRAGSVYLLHVEQQNFLPWSFQLPAPHERTLLWNFLADETSDNRALGLVKAVAWIAIATSRSYGQAKAIAISSASGGDWTLTRECKLVRLPPRRRNGWRSKSEPESQWVVPEFPEICIEIPHHLACYLEQALVSHANAKTIAEVFDDIKPHGSQFKSVFGANVPRITHGLLANVQAMEMFRANPDAAFVRLATARPNSGLPGACGYGYWQPSELYARIAQAMKMTPALEACGYGDVNAMGCLLAPLETLLVASIQQAGKRLEELRETADPITFHNYFCAWTVAMLLSATGARPLLDNFESIRFFDFEDGLVFINDKITDEIHQGRVIPLVAMVCEFIITYYLPHLAFMADALRDQVPELASMIRELSNRHVAEQGLPMFFMLEATGDGIGWISAGETAIRSMDLFDWPLPLNLFRHRLARQLRLERIDPELIDAVLGHAEYGGQTHGVYSMRTWEDDMFPVHAAMANCFGRLNWPSVAGFTQPPVLHLENAKLLEREGAFGEQARYQTRMKRILEARRDAKTLINKFLDGRLLEDLSQADLDKLSLELLLTAERLPHTRGYLRYSVLISRLDRLWLIKRKRVHLQRRFYRAIEESAWNALAINAGQWHEALKSLMTKIGEGTVSGIHPRVRAALQLLSEFRVTNPAVLKDAFHHTNIRVVAIDGQPYLEHVRDPGETVVDANVHQYAITWEVANRLAGPAPKVEDKDMLDGPVPEALADFADVTARHAGRKVVTLNNLLSQAARIMAQFNLRQLPGVVAAHRSGKLASSSASWRDRIRFVHGKRVDLDADAERRQDVKEDAGAKAGEADQATVLALHGELEKKQEAAGKLFKELRDLLKRDPAENPRDSTRRLKVAQDCAGIIDKYGSAISSANYILGRWVHSLIYTGRSQERVKLSSIERYMSALSPGFEQLAYDLDLDKLDAADVTVFYVDFAEWLQLGDKKYVMERLAEFHRFAHREFEVENPDWSEVPWFAAIAASASCLIGEREYLQALELCVKRGEGALRIRRARALVLLLCYRFGLRPKEAYRLSRRDLVVENGLVAVLVRDNFLDSLKTSASRRMVPLVFSLTDFERELVEELLDSLEARYGDSLSEPLFYDEACPGKALKRVVLVDPIIQILREVTANPRMVLHDARHSAACRIALALQHLELPGWKNLSDGKDDAGYIEAMLLAVCGCSRRRSWALARYLGHSHPMTSFNNYIHFLDDWGNQIIGVAAGSLPRKLRKKIIMLDNLPEYSPIEPLDQNKARTACVTIPAVLQFLRMLAKGRTMERATRSAGITPDMATRITGIVERLSARAKFGKTLDVQGTINGRRKLEWLKRIRETAWDRLMDMAEDIPKHRAGATAWCHVGLDIESLMSDRWELVLWEEVHFAFAKALLHALDMAPSDLRVMLVGTANCQRKFGDIIDLHGFRLVLLDEAGAPGQIGVGRDGMARLPDMDRCVLRYQENSQFPIRNRMQFLLMSLAFWAAEMSAAST